MEQIGVRELRQQASRYLARVARGESIEVTDRGRPVARLVPIPADAWSGLLASGQITAPTEPGDIADQEPVDYGIDASGTLQAMRDLER
jgi:prevent-host-death family protein